MLFNSLVFLLFIGLFLPAFFLTSGRLRLALCLVASYVFYGWWDWRFLGLILFSTGVNYLCGYFIGTSRTLLRRKLWLAASVATSLGVLAVFKYAGFFVASLEECLDAVGVSARLGTLQVILPVGISFYTFQAMSYAIDVYRGRLVVERNFFVFATFVAFFPQLVAGPIVRASVLLPQLRRPYRLNLDDVMDGVGLMLWGYLLKVGLADSLALVVDSRFASPVSHSSVSLMVGAVFYSFQIYADFAGYSSIAIGLARILGFDFGVNFDRPYFATGFQEFWRRWHISLSTWLRDYLYISLGGSRGSPSKTHRNLMLTMLLGGLWHGAGWNFVAWGGLHGAYLTLERLSSSARPRLVAFLRLPAAVVRAWNVAFVFVVVTLTWVFFRAPGIQEAWYYLSHMLAFDNLAFSSIQNKFQVMKGMLLIFVVWGVEAVSLRVDLRQALLDRPVVAAASAAAVLWMILLFGTFSNNAFIYFQF